MPRIAHAVLPISGKGDSDWSYAWVPVVGPIVGGILGAIFYHFIYLEISMIGLIIFIVVLFGLVVATKQKD